MIVNDSMTVHACALHNSGAEATRHALHFWNTAHSIGISLLLVESARKEKHHGTPKSGKRLRPATLAALGIVYGDIGTSPLYAVRECFAEPERLAINDANVLGVMSLILWSMFVGVAVKYLVFVMRADFDGEGGILALMTLARPGVSKKSRGVSTIVLLGLCGAGLLYGDGVITPAISVLNAVEGAHIATPTLDHFFVPTTLAILFVLFFFQRRGTAHSCDYWNRMLNISAVTRVSARHS